MCFKKQKDYPTCSTCKMDIAKWCPLDSIYHDDTNDHDLCNFNGTQFGCIYHSELEVKDGLNS